MKIKSWVVLSEEQMSNKVRVEHFEHQPEKCSLLFFAHFPFPLLQGRWAARRKNAAVSLRGVLPDIVHDFRKMNKITHEARKHNIKKKIIEIMKWKAGFGFS